MVDVDFSFVIQSILQNYADDYQNKLNVTLEVMSLYLQTCLSREVMLTMDKKTSILLLTDLKRSGKLLSWLLFLLLNSISPSQSKE